MQTDAAFLAKALRCALKTPAPSRFFRGLEAGDLLSRCYPEIAALVGVPQHLAYHPEGDVFEHTMIVLDRVAAMSKNPVVRFAALVHDLGKALTLTEDFMHSGHETKVGAILDGWAGRLPLPTDWWRAAKTVGKIHMLVPRIKGPGDIVAIFEHTLASPVSVEDLLLICRADDMTGSKQPPDLSAYLAAYAAVEEEDAPAGLSPGERRGWVHRARLAAVARLYPGRETGS